MTIGAEFDEILSAARDGDEWAIAVLWRALHPRLLRYVRGLEPAAAEDVESETWLQAARDLRSFHGDEVEFRAWMFTIARHRLIDWRRSAARRPSVPMAPSQLPEGQGPGDPADVVLEHLDTEAALAIVARLPSDQAEMILLRVLGGLDTNRVAAILGKRPGAVRVLQHRGLRRLAELLSQPEPATGGVTK